MGKRQLYFIETSGNLHFMAIKIEKHFLDYQGQKLDALVVMADPEKIQLSRFAILCHGYTAHKGTLLNWATKIAEAGGNALIFDLPGHYLGGFHEVEDFQIFTQKVPELFIQGYQLLTQCFLGEQSKTQIMLGGHSLGALLALKAAQLDYFQQGPSPLLACVGLGAPPIDGEHIFNSPFYKATLNVRRQLVSKELSPEIVFPWVKREKENMQLKNKTVYLLSGEDDAVVGKDGAKKIHDQLVQLGNKVILETPKRLPHHLPELASTHLRKILKDQGFFSP
jgi:alpha-beta hydrolase superfamily lysophospholipase